MKMVAASKLRAIQTRTENSRGLWKPFTALLGDIPSVDVKKNVVVTISSDKGLCGGINSTSVKISRGLYKINSGPEKECKYAILGEKAKAQLVRDSKKNIELSITELQKNPLNYTQVMFNAILENACSEQGARMSSMDGSSRNPGDMLDCLTLTYNRIKKFFRPPAQLKVLVMGFDSVPIQMCNPSSTALRVILSSVHGLPERGSMLCSSKRILLRSQRDFESKKWNLVFSISKHPLGLIIQVLPLSFLWDSSWWCSARALYPTPWQDK